MGIPNTERVGVFSESLVSKEVMGFPGTCFPMGIVAQVDPDVCTDLEPKPYAIQTYADAVTSFGKESEMAKLVRIVTLIGVNKLVCVPVISVLEGAPTKDEYLESLDILKTEEAPEIIICDSISADVHLHVRNHCDVCSTNRKERRAHLGAMAASVSAWVALALPLNSGRVTLWASVPLSVEGTAHSSSVYFAAACAAYDALELDPAMPLHNIQVTPELFGGLYNRFEDADYEALYAGGLAAARTINGKVYIDRWVTTYTKDDGVSPAVPDNKYQEGTVAKVKDFVDRGLRNRLSTLHPREKAGNSTVGEIKADAIAQLEVYEGAEIIESPQIISVERQPDKRTRVHVNYVYKVVLPLNTIFLHGTALI